MILERMTRPALFVAGMLGFMAAGLQGAAVGVLYGTAVVFTFWFLRGASE